MIFLPFWTLWDAFPANPPKALLNLLKQKFLMQSWATLALSGGPAILYNKTFFQGSLALSPFSFYVFSSKTLLEVIVKGTGQNRACLITDFRKTG